MKRKYSRVLAVVALMLAGSATAQQYPLKPVRLVVAFVGATAEIYSRMIAQQMTESFGQQVIVDPRGGANGIVGSEIVAKSPPDGYTLLAATDGSHTINPQIYSRIPYDAQRSFEPVSQYFDAPLMLVVHPSLPAGNVKEFIGFVRAHPGEITYASVGSGSSMHLAGELLAITVGVKMVHVPYKGGGGQQLTGIIGGEVASGFTNPAIAIPMAKVGKLRALAIANRSRLAAMPELPTLEQAGDLPGFLAVTWTGMFAPAGTPAEIVQRLAAEVAKTVRRPDVREHMTSLGLVPVGNTPEEFSRRIRSDTERYGKLIKQIGLRVD